MAIAKQRNLKAAGLAPVVLFCNYEAHNVPAYIFNTSSTSLGFGDPDFLSSTDFGDWLVGIYYVTLIFDSLALNTCNVSPVTCPYPFLRSRTIRG